MLCNKVVLWFGLGLQSSTVFLFDLLFTLEEAIILNLDTVALDTRQSAVNGTNRFTNYDERFKNALFVVSSVANLSIPV